MKTRTQKLVSLLLTFVMLLGMIPMGAVSVFAAGTDGSLSIGENDAAGTVYTIYGPKDWATVAAAASAGNTFEGKVIKLGASFGGTQGAPITLSTLFASTDSAYRFMGEFDGNNQTISYVNVTGKSMFAKECGNAAKFYNLTLSNVALTANAAQSGLLIGTLYGENGENEIRNVTVIKSAISTNYDYAGGLVGCSGQVSKLSISECNVEVSITTAASASLGILMGYSEPGTVSIDKCVVSGSITGTSTTATLHRAGGFLGMILSRYNKDATNVSITNSIVNNVSISSEGRQQADTRGVGLAVGQVYSNAESGYCDIVKIENCKISGSITTKNGYMGGIVGMLNAPPTNLDFDVINTTVNANLNNIASISGKDVATHKMGVGGAVGVLTGIGDTNAAKADICFDRVKIQGTLSSPYGCTGGLIGLSYGSVGNTSGMDVDVTVKNCEIDPTIRSASDHSNYGVAMVVGHWGGYAWSAGDSYHTGELNIENCLIDGSISAPSMTGALAAVVGFGGYFGTTVNINNCAITTAFPNNILKPAGDLTGSSVVPCAGVIGGRIRTNKSGKTTMRFNVNNCVTTYEGTAGTDFFLISNSCDLVFNDNAATVDTYHCDDSVLSVSSDKISSMIKYENITICGTTVSMIKRIGGHITGGFLQTTATYTVTPEEDEAYTAYAVRFIALSQLDAPKNAGITVVVKDTDGNLIKTFTTLNCKTYDQLIGYGPDGAKLPVYDATNYAYGASKFIAVVIEDIPTGTAYTFEVTPHYTTESGLTVTGETRVAEISANGVLTNAVD